MVSLNAIRSFMGTSFLSQSSKHLSFGRHGFLTKGLLNLGCVASLEDSLEKSGVEVMEDNSYKYIYIFRNMCIYYMYIYYI